MRTSEYISREVNGSATQNRAEGQAGSLPEGPTYSPLRQTIDWYRSPIKFLETNQERYGSIYSVRLGPLKRAAVVADPMSVRKIFRASPEEMLMGDANGLLKPVVGRNSLLVLDRQEHLQHRRMIAPSLSGGHVTRFEQAIEIATSRAFYEAPTSVAIGLEPFLERIGLDVTMEVVLGVTDRARRERVSELFVEMMQRCDSPLALVPQMRRKLGGLSPYARLMKVIARLDAELMDLFAERALAEDLDERADALSMMIRRGIPGRPNLGKAELRDEVVTLMMAGQETTTGALSWATERIAHTPDVQQRLLAEIDAGESDQYLQATIKETLRQRPVVPVLVRKLAVDVELGGYTFPKGWVLMPAIALVHQNPEIYPEPDRFNPDRFMRPPSEDMIWLPFGGGARRCVGAPLAELQMKVVLRTLLGDYSLEAGQAEPEAVRRQRFTLAPENRSNVILRSRAKRTPRFRTEREPARQAPAGLSNADIHH